MPATILPNAVIVSASVRWPVPVPKERPVYTVSAPDMPTMIRSATVLLAFIRSPLRWPDGQLIWAMEIGVPAPFGGCEFSYVEGNLYVYSLTNLREPMILDSEGKPLALSSEIGPGSIVHVLVDRKMAMTMRAVAVLRHVVHNPFGESWDAG